MPSIQPPTTLYYSPSAPDQPPHVRRQNQDFFTETFQITKAKAGQQADAGGQPTVEQQCRAVLKKLASAIGEVQKMITELKPVEGAADICSKLETSKTGLEQDC